MRSVLVLRLEGLLGSGTGLRRCRGRMADREGDTCWLRADRSMKKLFARYALEGQERICRFDAMLKEVHSMWVLGVLGAQLGAFGAERPNVVRPLIGAAKKKQEAANVHVLCYASIVPFQLHSIEDLRVVVFSLNVLLFLASILVLISRCFVAPAEMSASRYISNKNFLLSIIPQSEPCSIFTGVLDT